jgi:hypothetical protein
MATKILSDCILSLHNLILFFIMKDRNTFRLLLYKNIFNTFTFYETKIHLQLALQRSPDDPLS